MSSKAFGLAQLGNVYNDGALSNRNLIINGAMQVAQRGTSSTAVGVHTVDRFGCISGVPTITQSQQSLTPSDTPYARGFRKSFRATVTTASNSATSFIQFEQRIEAQDISQSGWEYTSSSSYLTLSFWAKSSLAGTYYVQFRTSDGASYYYNKSFTLPSNTWSKVTCTVAGNSNLTINTDNGEGFRVLVSPDYGTDYSGHAEAVEDAWYERTQVSGYTPSFLQDWRNTPGATFDVTGVQLEVGDTATPFEHRSFGQELALCQRYYERSYDYGTASGTATGIGSAQFVCNNYSSGLVLYTGQMRFLVAKRAIPTFSFWSHTGVADKWFEGVAGFSEALHNPPTLYLTGHIGTTFYMNTVAAQANTMYGHWAADAEL